MISGYGDIISDGDKGYLRDYKTSDDGRKESKMKISKEVYDALVEWKNHIRHNLLIKTADDKWNIKITDDKLINSSDISDLDNIIEDWWLDNNISYTESNNRLIAIIRWVNGEDVFEVDDD